MESIEQTSFNTADVEFFSRQDKWIYLCAATMTKTLMFRVGVRVAAADFDE
jgi:hypothetical protein